MLIKIAFLLIAQKIVLKILLIRIESAIKEVLGDDVKKQTETVVAGTLKYADKEGNEINYHILKTTYYEADPSEITGLNVDALGVLINPDSANRCKEMKIKNWDAALYEFDEHSYLDYLIVSLIFKPFIETRFFNQQPLAAVFGLDRPEM